MAEFYKYQGIGNDFIVLNRMQGGPVLDSATVVRWCDRHRGIGADGVLSVWPGEGMHARMQVQNADGSESDMCGNGLRCVAQFLYDQKLAQGASLKLGAGSQIFDCTRVSNNTFQIHMGTAVWEHADLAKQAIVGEPVTLELDERAFAGTCVFLGNPHFVIFLPDSTTDDPMVLAQRFGAALESHAAFRNRANISFAKRTTHGFKTVVFERGVGITQACGSGACAVGVAAVRRGLWPVETPLDVELPGGVLSITITRPNQSDYAIAMQGAAHFVFRGEVL